MKIKVSESKGNSKREINWERSEWEHYLLGEFVPLAIQRIREKNAWVGEKHFWIKNEIVRGRDWNKTHWFSEN